MQYNSSAIRQSLPGFSLSVASPPRETTFRPSIRAVRPIPRVSSVKFAEATEDRPRAISSIGIELYGPLPGGVAVGGRFAPEVVKVRGLREIPIEAATRPTR